MPIQKTKHSRIEFERIDNLTIFIMIKHHNILDKATKLLKRNSTYEKFRPDLGDQQKISESLGVFKDILG